MTTYKEIPFGPWALAVGLSALPAFVLPAKWVWSYVGLVLVYYIVFNTDEIGLLVEFVQAKIKEGSK